MMTLDVISYTIANKSSLGEVPHVVRVRLPVGRCQAPNLDAEHGEPRLKVEGAVQNLHMQVQTLQGLHILPDPLGEV